MLASRIIAVCSFFAVMMSLETDWARYMISLSSSPISLYMMETRNAAIDFFGLFIGSESL